MTEQIMGKDSRVEADGMLMRPGEQMSASNRLFEDLYAVPEFRKNEFYKEGPELKNGMASEKLQDIEKWVDDEKRCGLTINQDVLEKKLMEFGKSADEMWKKIDESGTPDEKAKRDIDSFITGGRFDALFDLLDPERKQELGPKLPWSIAPGE